MSTVLCCSAAGLARRAAAEPTAATGGATANPIDAEVAARRAEAARLAGRPEAIVPLLGILDLWNDADDRAAIAATLDEVARDPRQRPEVRGRATYLRSIVADRLGDEAGAKKLRASLGLVTGWLALGPFDDEGKAGDRRTLPPEQELLAPIDPKKEYPGKERPVAWRPLPERLVAQGLIPLDAALRPDTDVVGFATAFVRVERDTDAAVRVGASGAIKAWVNGRLAVERDEYGPVRIDQAAGGARLRKGWNRVEVKVGGAESGWSFFLRLTAPDGSPIAFTTSTEPALAKEIPTPPRSEPAVRVASLAEELRRAGEEPKGSPAQRAARLRAWGLYLHYVLPEEGSRIRASEAVLEKAAELRPSTEAYRLVAMAAVDADRKRKWLEQAVSLADKGATPPTTAVEHARALDDLGDTYERLHRERRAEALWREALSVDAAWFPAAVHLATLAADRGLPARAESLLDDVRKQRRALSVLRAAASLADRRGRRAEAERDWKQLADAARDDLLALRELYGYARSRGDVSRALELLDAITRARPDLLSVAVDRADLLDGVGRSAEAHAALAAALGACPDEPRLLERDGRVLHRLGRDREAVAEFRRALDLRPQNPDLRAYLDYLAAAIDRGVKAVGRVAESDRAGAGSDLAREYARPVEELIASERKHGRSSEAGSARVLLDLTATRVHPNGLSESFSQRVIEILDERGAREQGDFGIRYTPDSQAVEVKAARVYKKSGEVVEAVAQTDHDASEPWYGLYYDVRVEQVELPRLDPGDVVDVEYVLSDVGKRNLFADYFGELHLLQEDLPRAESEYVLITPKARAFYFNHPRLERLTVTQEEHGDERVYTFRAREVPKIDSEPGMPGFTSVAAYVHVSTYKTWEEVASWYRGLIQGQLDADDRIKEAVAEATKGLTDEREKIRAVYDLVVKQTRYVGLEFGIHGYKPYSVSQIFQRKFGDCKDKASLLVAMLKEIGVDATLVLARTRRGGDLDPFPASLAPFDHAIVYVPKYDLWLDGTAEFSGSDELPAQDQDVPVLLVAEGRLTRTPVLAADRNLVRRDLKVDLSPTGKAKVELRMSVAGEVAHEWRSHYQAPGERRERFEKAENATHPGARVTSVDFPALEDLERPVEVRSELDVPSWARAPRAGGDLVMPALGREGELLRSYARLSRRRHELVLGYPWEQQERVAIALPPGYSPKRLPEARRIDTPFGTFTVSVERRGREVDLTTSLKVTRHKIEPDEYPAFRRFCLDVDAAVGQELVVSHE